MTTFEALQKRRADLSVRAEKLRPCATVMIFLGDYGWSTSSSLLISENYLNNHPTPDAALDEIERLIAAKEDRDGMLARTLGVEAA